MTKYILDALMRMSRKVKFFLRKTLRTIGFFIFFAGDSDRSKKELNKVLDKRQFHSYLVYSLVLLFVSLLFIITSGPFISQKLFKKPTTFNVSAVTEEVKVFTHKIPMSKWPVQNVDVSRDCPDEDVSEKNQHQKFSGSISVNPSIQITFTRIAFGDLKVTLYSNENKSVGDLYDEEDEHVSSLTNCSFFYITKLAERSASGNTIVLPISGDISAGSDIRFLTQNKMPVLKEGEVTILDRSFIIGENYSVGPYALGTGDTFEVQDSSVSSQGFISINEDAAIKLVFRAKGLKGIIKRYQSEDYEIRNSYWSKLYHDEALSLAWVLIFILFNIIRVYLRFLVN